MLHLVKDAAHILAEENDGDYLDARQKEYGDDERWKARWVQSGG
jgi:hypothetical protein